MAQLSHPSPNHCWGEQKTSKDRHWCRVRANNIQKMNGKAESGQRGDSCCRICSCVLSPQPQGTARRGEVAKMDHQPPHTQVCLCTSPTGAPNPAGAHPRWRTSPGCQTFLGFSFLQYHKISTHQGFLLPSAPPAPLLLPALGVHTQHGPVGTRGTPRE